MDFVDVDKEEEKKEESKELSPRFTTREQFMKELDRSKQEELVHVLPRMTMPVMKRPPIID